MNNRTLKNKAASNLYCQICSAKQIFLKFSKILRISALPLKYTGSKFNYCGPVLQITEHLKIMVKHPVLPDLFYF